jgi:hypothetical protein
MCLFAGHLAPATGSRHTPLAQADEPATPSASTAYLPTHVQSTTAELPAAELVCAGHAMSLGTGRTAVSIAAGHFRTCAVLDDRSVKCWA